MRWIRRSSAKALASHNGRPETASAFGSMTRCHAARETSVGMACRLDAGFVSCRSINKNIDEGCHDTARALEFAYDSLLLMARSLAGAQELEKVRIVYASRSIPFLSSFVAKEKGFYRIHGLDVELIQVAPRLAITPLATNEVDYSMNIGSSLRAAMRGLPVRAVSTSTVAPVLCFSHAGKVGPGSQRKNRRRYRSGRNQLSSDEDHLVAIWAGAGQRCSAHHHRRGETSA